MYGSVALRKNKRDFPPLDNKTKDHAQHLLTNIQPSIPITIIIIIINIIMWSPSSSSSCSSFSIPEHFVCPLTLEIMKDPLCSKYGHNFERSAILDWLSENDTCPMTRKELSMSKLIPNASLRLRIKAWQGANEVDLLLLLNDEEEEAEKEAKEAKASAAAGAVSLRNEAEIQAIRRQAKEEMNILLNNNNSNINNANATTTTRRTHSVVLPSSSTVAGPRTRRA